MAAGPEKRKRGTIRRLPALVGAATLALLLLAGSAAAIRLQAGDIVIVGDGHVIPKRLPQDHNAPIRLRMHGRMSTLSGALPPVIETLMFEFDRHGALRTEGLAVCTMAKLKTTTVPQARKLCPGAIVGTGKGSAIVKFPEQAPIPVSSPITIFNGPSEDGKWTALVHAYNTVPVPVTVLFKATIEKINRGRYGYRVETEIPKLSGGYGIPISGDLTVDRKWTFAGRRYSYINARCADGRLQARGEFTFKDGTQLEGNFVKPCTMRR
ncbi:MAG TPA: hypothetical protein VK889_03160 [Solirubrobacterales bacterium]|nr:hypothetical protein [Solirubrobacterales bacterium]